MLVRTLGGQVGEPPLLGGLGLEWLLRIRWAALVGQLFVFLLAQHMLEQPLATTPFVAVFSMTLVSNLLLLIPALRNYFRNPSGQGILVLLDVLLLTLLLYFYGGHTNPFSMVYFIHVVLAAMLLSSAWTWLVSALAIAAYAALFLWFIEIPELAGGHGAHHGHFDLHLQGMLVGFVLIVLLMSGFLQKMRAELERREKQLREQAAYAEQLTAVTTLSASFAHELATPLGAVSLSAGELLAAAAQHEIPESMRGDLAALELDLGRCRQILERVRAGGVDLLSEQAERVEILPLVMKIRSELSQEAKDGVLVQVTPQELAVHLPPRGLGHIVYALLKNAIEAGGDAPISFTAGREGRALHLMVEDRGAGMDSGVLHSLGRPFFSTKDSGRGMGLGIFITQLFVGRLGGTVRVSSTKGAGTTVDIYLPDVVE